MKIKVSKSSIKGSFVVPGSKSHTIRAVAFASLADGESSIFNPLLSEDAASALSASAAFGSRIIKEDHIWKISGHPPSQQIPQSFIDMGNSGTSLRIFSGIAALSNSEIVFDGDKSLRTRPMSPLLGALEKLGARTSSKNGFCPISVRGSVKGGKISIECKSSQFLSSLLICLPLAEGDSEITATILNEIPYVEITIDWLKSFGIRFEASEDLMNFKIKGGQSYSPFTRSMPGDFSTATFPLVAAAVSGGDVKIYNLDFSDRQGDKEVFKMIESMGTKISRHQDHVHVSSGNEFKGGDFDLNSTPDALPAMAVAACFAKGETRLRNVAQARIKETDRIACMTCELRKMGAYIQEFEDGMLIKNSSLHGTQLESYADHRIAMSLTIAAMNASGESIINEAESASVTYPDFIRDFTNAGAKIQILAE